MEGRLRGRPLAVAFNSDLVFAGLQRSEENLVDEVPRSLVENNILVVIAIYLDTGDDSFASGCFPGSIWARGDDFRNTLGFLPILKILFVQRGRPSARRC